MHDAIFQSKKLIESLLFRTFKINRLTTRLPLKTRLLFCDCFQPNVRIIWCSRWLWFHLGSVSILEPSIHSLPLIQGRVVVVQISTLSPKTRTSFPIQIRYIISPVSPTVGCASKTSKGRHLGGSRSNAELPHLGPYNAKTQRLYSGHMNSSKPEPEPPEEETHLGRLCPNSFFWSLPEVHDRKWGLDRRSTGKRKSLPSSTQFNLHYCWTPIYLSILRSILPSLVDDNPRYLTPSHGTATPNLEGSIHFLAENHGLRLGGTDWTPSHTEPMLPNLCDGASQLRLNSWCPKIWGFFEVN